MEWLLLVDALLQDPEDPQADLYDVDDGALDLSLVSALDTNLLYVLESTIITLFDWYHNVAPSLFPNPTNATPLVIMWK